MRITPTERTVLKQTAVTCFGNDVVLKLFGSRMHDDKRGGDIDLLVQTTLTNPKDIARGHIQFLSQVYMALGEQKIDVLIEYPNMPTKPPIYAIAARDGLPL